MTRIADIISRARKQFFTGRINELSEFRLLLDMPKPGKNVIFIYGPAGQGKTTLMREFAELCRLNENPHVYIDSRDVIPSTGGFHKALCEALNVSSVQHVLSEFEKSTKTFVLFIDTYKKIIALDNWLREEFLPQLPQNVLTVFAARNHPSPHWISDSGWQNLVATIQLRNFSPSESFEYLKKRNVPSEQYSKIVDFTHGHPLALSLVADLYLQNPDKDFSPEDSQDIVQTILNSFMLKAPTPAHKTALEICSMTYVTTESLLSHVMKIDDAGEIFEWLKNLSFIENNKSGLYPHDLARESLIADLKWRNPDSFKHLYRSAGNYYLSKLENASGEDQRKYLFALNYLQRKNPIVRSFYNWEEANEYWVDLMKDSDVPVLKKMVRDFYGAESVKRFEYWLNHPAAQVWVWRSRGNSQSGFVMRININEIDEQEEVQDEMMQKAITLLRNDFHLRKGEISTVFRFWMTADTHQNISKLQSSIFLFITQYYLTTKGLAVHLLTVTNPEFWKKLLNYYGMEHVPMLDYMANNMLRGFFIHDWRKIPPKLWFDSLGMHEFKSSIEAKSSASKREIVVLNEEDFFQSVYEALKEYHSDRKLEKNQLIKSKVVLHSVPQNASESDCIKALKEKINEAIEQIKISPRNEKFHRILFRTFINPVGSQEQVADFLALPFSTYRRHLKKATTLVFEILWKQEIS